MDHWGKKQVSRLEVLIDEPNQRATQTDQRDPVLGSLVTWARHKLQSFRHVADHMTNDSEALLTFLNLNLFERSYDSTLEPFQPPFQSTFASVGCHCFWYWHYCRFGSTIPDRYNLHRGTGATLVLERERLLKIGGFSRISASCTQLVAP